MPTRRLPRWWNSFTLLAVILLTIGILGAILRDKMVYDPGRPVAGWEWLLYLFAGVLMLINGLLPPPMSEENTREKAREGDSTKE